MKTIRGKRAVVTGAASGIGRAIAETLAGHGVHLFLIDIDAQGLVAVAEQLREFNVEVVTAICDLSQSADIDSAVDVIGEQWNGVDILVNNAGVVYYGPSERMTEDQLQWILDVNLAAPIRLTRRLLPLLLQNEESHVVNVGSLAGLVAKSKLMAYQVSKFGLQGFSESLIAEYSRHGLGVTSVCPGYVDTSLFNNGQGTQGRRGIRQPPAIVTTSSTVVAEKTVRAIFKNRPLVTVTPLARALWLLKRISPTLYLSISGRQRRKSRRPFVTSDAAINPRDREVRVA